MQEAPAPVAHVAREQLVVAHTEDSSGRVVGVDHAAVTVEHEHALGEHLGRDLHAVLQYAQLAAPGPQLVSQPLDRRDRLRQALAGEVQSMLGVVARGLGDLSQRMGDRAWRVLGETPVSFGVEVRDRGSIHRLRNRLAARFT